MRARLSLLLFFLLLACGKDEKVRPEGDLWIYANRFFDEANVRKYVFPQSNVTLKFVPEEEIAPYSGYGSPNPPIVRIVQTHWEKLTDIQKELLMFHELGHAMLLRVHTDELLPNCDYKSIMMDGALFAVYGEHSTKRKYYVDELFDRNTPYPDWGGTIGSNNAVLINDGATATFAAGINSTYTGIREDGALRINGGNPETEQASWIIEVPTSNIPAKATLIARFKMKLANVNGNGVHADFRADYNSGIYFYTSTALYEGNIKGTSEYREYTLILNCYPEYRPDIVFSLVFDATSTGDVWIKDVEVAYYE